MCVYCHMSKKSRVGWSALLLFFYTQNIFLLASSIFFINWTVHMSDNLPERVQILGHMHIICITVRENRIICCQIFCNLLLKSAFEWIFNVKIKWKYLIQKFHDICLSYYLTHLILWIRCPTLSFVMKKETKNHENLKFHYHRLYMTT
jgi:hypothetical protein